MTQHAAQGSGSTDSDSFESRHRHVLEVLAQATRAEVDAAWHALPARPEVHAIRQPEVGLVMVRGRAGGGGSPFNLGEVSVTRALIRLDSGTIGIANVLGRDRQHARLGAIFDALWQEEFDFTGPAHRLVAQVENRLRSDDRQRSEETAATRVDFFTVARGED